MDTIRFYDIVTVGSATIDVFVKTKGDILKIMHPDMPEEHMLVYPVGTKILIEKKTTMTGGGGTNSAVSFSRLGFKTAFLGKIGNDDSGHRILEQLSEEKVEFIGKVQDTKGEELTGYSVILDSIEDDRTILTYKGVNDELQYNEVSTLFSKTLSKSLFKRHQKNLFATKWFYFSSMVGRSYKTLESLAEWAHKNHALIAFNPSTYLCKQGKKYLQKLLKLTTVLILNLEEAKIVTEHQHAESAETLHQLLKSLRHMGPRIVVITNGKQAVHAYDGHHVYSVIPRNVRVHETTGAGDAFASAFIAGLILKNNIPHALRMGMANSESIVTHFGAKTGLLSLKQIEKALKKHSVKVSRELI